jgi:RNA polymerase II elongation factor ELL
MWLQARQALYTLGIPESDAAWDYVRTRPGSTATGASKVVVGAKRATGTIGADRKKNIGSTSKGPVEAKDEGVRPVQTNRAREDAVPVSRPTKPNPKREDDDAAVVPRRPPGTSVSKIVARESVPSQPQAQGPSKKAGPTDVRVKRDETSKMSRRPTPVQSSSSREREQEREKPTIVAKKREHDSDLDREKAKTGPTHKVKKRKDIASDMESLRDWDGTDTGKTGLKRKKLREDYDDKDRVNGTGTTVKRRKMADEDRPYKPGSSSSGVSKVRERERERDRESDRGHDKAGDRDTHPTSKRPRGSDRGSAEPPPPLPRKLAVRDREPRQREREPERSISPPRRVKREPSPSPQSSLQRDNSPLPRVSVKRTDSPLRDVVKREPSPPPRLLPRRDDTPLSVRNSKRGASPPRPPARKRDRDRDRESSVTTRRRRSPIYTSSEDDPGTLAVRRNAPSSVTSSSSSRDVMRNSAFTPHPQPPSAPYPKDRESLQSRYRKGYRNYIAVYHQWSEERAKIEDALADLGREGSFSDGDVEMMDEEGLRELADRYAAWTRELEGIRNAYSAVVERMDMAT